MPVVEVIYRETARYLCYLLNNYDRKKYYLDVYFEEGAEPTDFKRSHIVDYAMKNNFDWILWLDGDMSYPLDTFEKLISHNLPVVGGVYFTKHCPHHIQGRVVKDGRCFEIAEFYPDSKDLIEVSLLGIGCLLEHISVFYKMLEVFKDEWKGEKRFFEWVPDWKGLEAIREQSEDFNHCLKLQKIGIPIFLDTSVRCGHAGITEENYWAHKLISSFTKEQAVKAVKDGYKITDEMIRRGIDNCVNKV